MILLAGQSNMQNMATLITSGTAPTVVCRGGTRITEWAPGQPLFEALRPLLPHAETFWFWQGESDAILGGEPAEHWDDYFGQMMMAIREEAPNLPVLFGECPPIEAAPFLDVVRSRQWLFGNTGIAKLIPSGDTATRVDPHHLAAESLHEVGRRFVEAYNERLVAG